MYDIFSEGEGDDRPIVLGARCADGTFSTIEAWITQPNTTIGLPDVDAHVNLIFDAVGPTCELVPSTRNRAKGPRMPLESIAQADRQQCRAVRAHGPRDPRRAQARGPERDRSARPAAG